MMVVLALMASSLMVTTVVAERNVDMTGDNANWILSNDGFGTLANNLTCGEIITLQITNNSLDTNTRYKVGVWNGTHWRSLTTVGSRTSDSYGDLSISFRVPGWAELGNSTVSKNPVTQNGTNFNAGDHRDNGTWNISLFHNNFTEGDDFESVQQVFSGLNATIKIGNQYFLKFFEDGEEIDHLIYNKIYTAFQVKIYNWTGTQLVEAKDDTTKYKFDVDLLNYSSPFVVVQGLGTDRTSGASTSTGLLIDDEGAGGISDSDKEKTFWVHVNHSTLNIDDKWLNSTIALPVLLDVTLPSPPDDVKWGDTFTVSGKVLDGEETGLKSYTVRIYYPISGGYDYDVVSTPSTVTTGSYSLTFETGSEKGYGAGTWYVGTHSTGTNRVDMSHEPPYAANFIPYHSFEVGTKDIATLTIHNSDDIVRSFDQTINVSVANASWMDEYEFRNMNIHITGIKGYDGTTEYERSDIVLMDTTIKGATNDRRCYYEFDYLFNETGTATIWASWPGNLTSLDNHGSSYGDRFGNHSTSLIANITGTKTFSVVSPGTMTVLVDNEPEKVVKADATCGSGWVNDTEAWTNISVYGSEETSHMNATISVSGCGLDFTINETATSHKNLLDTGFDDTGNGRWYNVSIIPKTAGTLTITITNGTTSIVKDYTITGLTGSVTTSVGDDLEITVGTTETITLTGVTEYAETKITFFDENWECQALLNESDDAGESSFTPDADDIDRVGYIVVFSRVTAYDQNMYEIIEVVPVDDLTIEVTTPDAGNQTLTVGLVQDIVVNFLGPDGNPVDDDNPDVEARLIDADHEWDDEWQSFTFTNIGSGEWEAEIQPWFAGQLEIRGSNASDGIKHIGTFTLDVEHATITFSPTGATAGIGLDNLTIDVTGVDANGNPLNDVTLYLWAEDDEGDLDFESSVDLDEDGIGEFEITEVGDIKTYINATLDDNEPGDGNRTLGRFDIDFPTFTLVPDTIYVGQSNIIEITAEDMSGNALDDIYLTLIRDNVTAVAPEPVETDDNGVAELSLNPSSSGKFNVTIVKELVWDSGQLDWDNMEYVVTDTVVTATHIRTMSISVSKSPIYQGETLTVTVTSGGVALSGVDVNFAEETSQTGTNGQVTFTVPDPGVESATYTITAEKAGYNDAERSITVIKVYAVQIVTPSTNPGTGEEFTISILAKGAALAGATVEFDGDTYTSGADGKVTLTAPSSKGTHTVSASYDPYTPATATITVVEGEDVPGFELLTIVAALGAAFILFKRRKKIQ